jgi:hypothetical protein
MTNLTILLIITFAVIIASYVLSVSKIDFSRHLSLQKKSENTTEET